MADEGPNHGASIVSLDACPAGVLEAVAGVYLAEWGWHYAQEWDVVGLDAIVDDLRRNEHASQTFVVLAPGQELVGTVALMAFDLRSHTHLRPWVSCLWVAPQHRRRGLGRHLMDHAVRLAAGQGEDAYLWCYSARERDTYVRWGFQLLEDTSCHGRPAHVMRRRADMPLH
jgi:GNAT superfamily N-acetyltransferase